MSSFNDDQEFRDHLVSSLATITSVQNTMKDSVEKGFHFFKEEHEKLAKAVELKAEASDVKELTEKHHELDKKVSHQSGIAIGVSGFLSMAIAGLTAWWTKH